MGITPLPLLSREGKNFPSSSTWPQVLYLRARLSNTEAKEGRSLSAGPMRGQGEGKPTQDPRAFFLLAPFGEGGYKGYGLALTMDVLAGVLTGSFFARNFVSGPGSRGCGHFFLAFDPQRFMPLHEFRKRTDEMIAQVEKGFLPQMGIKEKFYHPGERGYSRKTKWVREGIPMLPPLSQTARPISRWDGSAKAQKG